MESVRLLVKGLFEYQEGCGLSKRNMKISRYILNRFIQWLDGTDLRNVDRAKIHEYKKYLQAQKSGRGNKHLAPSTVDSYMSIVKSFFNYLALNDKILVNPFEGARDIYQKIRGERAVFTERDIETFLDSLPLKDIQDQCDKAMYELIYSSGLRFSDVQRLRIEHLNMEERVLMVRGKGNKDAYVPFSETARKFLIIYLNNGRKKRLKTIRNREAKSLVFLGVNGAIKNDAVSYRFKKLLKKCGLDKKGYTLHSIRHATGTHLLMHGASIRYVQELLRHEDLRTTQAYTRPSKENVKAVYRTYHPRENEYFKEIDAEYMDNLRELKARLIWGREASKQYQKEGNKLGFGRWSKFTDEQKKAWIKKAERGIL